MDAAPGHADRKQTGGLRSLDVERRVADVGSLLGARTETIECEEQRRRVGLVPLGLVTADNGLEEMLDRQPGERELYRLPPLRGDDAEPPALLLDLHEYLLLPYAALDHDQP